MPRALGVRSTFHQRHRCVVKGDEEQAHARCATPRQLLEKGDLFSQRSAAARPTGRPVRCCVARLDELAEPLTLHRQKSRDVVALLTLTPVVGKVLRQPFTDFGPQTGDRGVFAHRFTLILN